MQEDGIVFFENLGALRFLNELKDSSAIWFPPIVRTANPTLV